ncbi:hypothetical protein ACJX0J_008505, partial [Zea mays]
IIGEMYIAQTNFDIRVKYTGNNKRDGRFLILIHKLDVRGVASVHVSKRITVLTIALIWAKKDASSVALLFVYFSPSRGRFIAELREQGRRRFHQLQCQDQALLRNDFSIAVCYSYTTPNQDGHNKPNKKKNIVHKNNGMPG